MSKVSNNLTKKPRISYLNMHANLSNICTVLSRMHLHAYVFLCVSYVNVCVCSFMCNTCRFPLADGLRVREWLRRMRWQNWWPTGNSVLCSDHFEKDCFEQVGSHKRLRKNAVPTIFNFPKHLQWKASKNFFFFLHVFKMLWLCICVYFLCLLPHTADFPFINSLILVSCLLFLCLHPGTSCQETISGMYWRLEESLCISSKNFS